MKPIEPMEPMPPSTLERLKNNNIIQAWLVLFLALCFGSALAGVQMTLGPKIEINKINETREKVPELVLGKDAALKMCRAGGDPGSPAREHRRSEAGQAEHLQRI